MKGTKESKKRRKKRKLVNEKLEVTPEKVKFFLRGYSN